MVDHNELGKLKLEHKVKRGIFITNKTYCLINSFFYIENDLLVRNIGEKQIVFKNNNVFFIKQNIKLKAIYKPKSKENNQTIFLFKFKLNLTEAMGYIFVKIFKFLY